MKRAALPLLLLLLGALACNLPGLTNADPPVGASAFTAQTSSTQAPSVTPTSPPSQTPLPDQGAEESTPEATTVTPSPQPSPTSTPQFHIWSAQQALTLLGALNLKVGEARPALDEDLLGAPMLAAEALVFDLSAYCRGCSGRALSFATPNDLEAIRNYYAALGEQNLILKDNLLLHLDNRLSNRQFIRFQQTLDTHALRSVLEAHTRNVTSFESWQDYYTIDRGQQADPANGRAQRTYNRWEGDGLWYFGQSTWRYQAPDGSSSPPPYFPTTYQGQPLHYFFNYQCEPRTNDDPTKDCLNWQIYIELVGNIDDPTILMNWARGGWKSIRRKTPEWEVFYRTDAFGGQCNKANILANYDDAYLQDPANRAPLLIRLPDEPGPIYSGPEMCVIIFTSYTPRIKFVKTVDVWRLTTQMLSKTYDAASQRFVIKADNRYYKPLANIDGDMVYTQWAQEIYWMRQVKPEEPLWGGFEAFWWFSWKQPPDENLDGDNDLTWSNYQWCRVEPENGPDGLGALICE